MKRLQVLAAILSSLSLSGIVAAHIALVTPQAESGSRYAAYFRIGHGCDGAATTGLRIEIPDGVLGARPQPKPGWTIAIEKAPLPSPMKGEGGREVTERIAAVTWTGSLDADFFDDFGLLVKLPDTTGPIYFPATQTCGTAAVAWTDIPAPGQAWHDVAHPAPVLELTAANGSDGMAGMSHDQMATGPIAVTDGWVRASAGETGAAYAKIGNTGSEGDRLIAVKGDVADKIEIHEMTMDGGVMQMRPVEGVDIPAGGLAELKPGGLHVMLVGLHAPLVEGATVSLTFTFARAGDVAVALPVLGKAPSDEPHAHD